MTFPVYATSPLPYAVAGALLLVGCWRYLPGWLRVIGITIELLLVVLTMPLGANALAGWVQSRALPAAACAAPAPRTIVVLGGGGSRAATAADDFGALHRATLQRVFAAVALWQRIPDARVVISGGGRYQVPEAVLMANLAMRMGVPASALTVEGASRTTWENARNVARLAPPVPRRIWLVTSPMHLPRALGAFRAWGFSACAWPAEPREAARGIELRDFVPQGSAVRTAALALHEWLGGIRYAMLERQHARRDRSS